MVECLRIMWLWVRIPLLSLKLQICACFEQGVSWHSGNSRVLIHFETCAWHDNSIQFNCLFNFPLWREIDNATLYFLIGLVSIWNEGSIFIPMHTGIISYFWIWLFVTFCFIKFNAKVSLKSSGEGWLFSAEVRSLL